MQCFKVALQPVNNENEPKYSYIKVTLDSC